MPAEGRPWPSDDDDDDGDDDDDTVKGGVWGVGDHRGELLLPPEEDEHHSFQAGIFCQGDHYDYDRWSW